MSDILTRRQTHFVLWCPRETSPPALIIGQIINGNPPAFQELNRLFLSAVSGKDGLWELAAGRCNLTDGETYHYWFEVDDSLSATSQRIQVTDPLAYGVDYRLLAPANPSRIHPASVIGWSDGVLIPCDPNGEKPAPATIGLDKLPANNQLVIYELPTTWVRTSGFNEFERAVGTFRDVRALVEGYIAGANFPELHVIQPGRQYLMELGINALQFLPLADSIYAREWGYGTSHYLAPDYELGYPEGHFSPTSNQDLTDLINSCHQQGIRVFLDVVLGFMKDEPYRHIDFQSFYLENPTSHPDDPDAYSSRFNNSGGKEFRNSFGASSPRYVAKQETYDPISGSVKTISPARQHMLTSLTRWMQDFQIDGIRLDSVENVANWDFIQEFKDAAHAYFQQRYPAAGNNTRARFLVVGEELTLPKELLIQNRLDGLWNEHFQAFVRAAILGENCRNPEEPSFEWTVRRAIDCRLDGFRDGTEAINYLTSHDVEGIRKERLYNMLLGAITRENSGHLFDETKIKAEIRNNNGNTLSEDKISQLADQQINDILHEARLHRIKLAFVCLLTAVGIPMILAGEEFGDQHDLFDAEGNVTHRGGKQVDPVNFSRVDETKRHELFSYVAQLIRLRTTHPALSVNETKFIHVDFSEGKRVLVWQRGPDTDPVIIVANFSDFTTPFAPAPGTTYSVPNWPPTLPNHHWFEETQKRLVATGQHDKEPIFAWEAKVYRLIPDPE